MNKTTLLITSLVFLALPLQAHAAKGGEKGPDDRAWERANDNAKFKREYENPGKGKHRHDDGTEHYEHHRDDRYERNRNDSDSDDRRYRDRDDSDSDDRRHRDRDDSDSDDRRYRDRDARDDRYEREQERTGERERRTGFRWPWQWGRDDTQ